MNEILCKAVWPLHLKGYMLINAYRPTFNKLQILVYVEHAQIVIRST